jgi:hypothetical protein
MRILIQLILCLHLLGPIAANAQAESPLTLPLRDYGFMLSLALLGGMASWWAKVRKGDRSAMSIYAFIGELVTSALAGLLAFFVCKYFALSPWLTAAIVGMAGHMGTRALSAGEALLQRKVDRLVNSGPAPLDGK